MKKRILYFGHLGNRSYGDEIGLYLFKDFVKDNFPAIQVDYENVKVGDKLGLSKKYDFYLLGCGTCLSNLGRPYADQLLVQLCNKGLPFGVLGAGVFFEQRRNQGKAKCYACEKNTSYTRRYINQAKFIAVRDEASKSYLSSISPNKGIHVLYDPGLSVAYPKVPLPLGGGRPVLGINLAKGNEGCLGFIPFEDDKLSILAKFINTQGGKYEILFVPFNVKDEKVYERFFNKKIVKFSGWGYPRYISGVTQNCDLFLGVRVHSDITCSAYGVPFTSISYTGPNLNYLNHIGYTNHLTPTEFNLERLVEKFSYMENNQTSLRTFLLGKSKIARETYFSTASKLCKTILGDN